MTRAADALLFVLVAMLAFYCFAALSGCATTCSDNPNNMQCMSAEQIEQRLGEKL